jgi:Fic family protein
VTSHVVGLEAGLRTLPRRGAEFRGGDVVRRLGFWLAVIAQSAEDGLQELKRLELARQVMAQQVAGRRAHARVVDVMVILLELPVVTAPVIAQRLGITQQSARRSLEDLGSVVVEISGRSRFRAWRL